MNLLERKTDFDVKVKQYLQASNEPNQATELHYANYLINKYKDEFKSVNFNDKRNYVIIDFNNVKNN